MRTAVMTDSNSGITKAEAEKIGIFLMPMPVIIDGKTCFEGEDLTQEMFFQNLTDGKDVSTSQPSPGDVLEMWDMILDMGYDDLVYIPMSSGLSNSCETAIGLSAEYDGQVQVADNHRISVTLSESVKEAKVMAESGVNAREIKADLEARAYDASIYITVDTLEFLKKGGRITPAAAALGAALNIKPVLTIQGECLDAFAKVRGMKKGKNRMIEALKSELDTRFQNIDRRRIIIGAAGAGLAEQEKEEWIHMLQDAFPWTEVVYGPLSFSISCHTGPGAVGAGIVVRK